MALPIKKKDKVVVLTGRDRGKRGEVLRVFPAQMRLLVSKVNLVKVHKKATREQMGGIISQEASIAMASVALVCPRCDQPMRPQWQLLADGSKVRLCRKCSEQ